MAALDTRVRYWLEARECLLQVRGQKPEQPEFWANLLGAVANASMANSDDAVIEAADAVLGAPRPKLQKKVQRRIKRALSG